MFITLDPTGSPRKTENKLAPRPVKLKGATVGLLANTKVNGDRLLAAVGELLVLEHGVKEVVARTKHHFDQPAKPELLDELTSKCDVVVTAIGD